MKTCLILLLCCSSLCLQAQNKDAFYVFDADQKPTDAKNAAFLLRVRQKSDTCWQWDYYHFAGPLITRENYKDREGKIYHGVSYHYADNGRLDSTATFVNGKKHGDAYRLSADSFSYRIKYVFDNDALVETVDMTKKDSSKLKAYDDEKESEYPGGLSKWGRYLTKNLSYPDRALKGNIQGQSVIGFVVDTKGNVSDLIVARSVEFSLDDEATRIITESGKWNPAFQNGKAVKTYKLQPVTFRLQ
ncbi:MAG: energy transducer TonB [Flavihumibacter sp.]